MLQKTLYQQSGQLTVLIEIERLEETGEKKYNAALARVKGKQKVKIKIIGLNCSPRNNSNSKLILNIALDNLKKKYQKEVEYKIIDLISSNIEHCQACDVCGKTKDTGEFIPCVINDDVAKIIEEMNTADGFLVATPEYFGLASD